jgi:IS30 family transposase
MDTKNPVELRVPLLGRTLLCKMDGNGAETALDSFTHQMRRLPTALRKSMTYDRGSDPLMVCEQTTAGQ